MGGVSWCWYGSGQMPGASTFGFAVDTAVYSINVLAPGI
jgi:hypothetical protein